MNLADFRFTECAYFYKLKGGESLTNANIHSMMVEVTNDKIHNYAYNAERQDGGNGILFSLRVFKQKNDKPSFFTHFEPGWEETKVGFYLFVEYDRYVAVLKRYANIPKFINEKLENVDYTTLMALETQQNSVFRKLSMQNLDGADYAMRNKTYESLDLSNNVSAIGINRYYVRSVAGTNNGERFALQLNTSKVNEFGEGLTVRDVCGWVRQKVDEIGGLGAMPETLLSAFASPVKYSTLYAQLQPVSVLIFYSLVESLREKQLTEFYHTNSQGQRALVSKNVIARYIDCFSKAYTQVQVVAKHDGNHYYVGDNNAIEIRITKTGIKLYNKTWRNIEVEGTEGGEYDGNLQNLINDNNQFNVYFKDRDLVYNNRTLLCDTRLLSSVRQFVKVLDGKGSLNGLLYEKYSGQSARGLVNWHPQSIFYVVERDFKANYEYFICDDCNYEWADHIGISKEKVSFFVSKHKTSKDSASDFQDVVSQALKNLGNLSPTRAQLNAKSAEWSGVYLTSHILRFYSASATDTVQKAIDLWLSNLMSPNFTREMCLVVDFLEAQTFEQQLDDIANGGHPAYEQSLFQRLWILSAFVNGCLEVGVKPVIYCKP